MNSEKIVIISIRIAVLALFVGELLRKNLAGWFLKAFQSALEADTTGVIVGRLLIITGVTILTIIVIIIVISLIIWLFSSNKNDEGKNETE